jgi:2-polyprenyl-3-methyl-5-hydroxy-6-metoxy-1,4-benzoquinol methylase
MIDRHINRYNWASTYLKETDVVLDAPCGSGYGSQILAKNCRNVIGIDINQEAISYALLKYRQEDKIDFLCDDLVESKSLPDIFDAIVCIEGIEHVDKDDAGKLLDHFYFQLKQDGKFIVTTPDKAQSQGMNQFHKNEYTKEEIETLVARYFYLVGTQIIDGFVYIVAEKRI